MKRSHRILRLIITSFRFNFALPSPLFRHVLFHLLFHIDKVLLREDIYVEIASVPDTGDYQQRNQG